MAPEKEVFEESTATTLSEGIIRALVRHDILDEQTASEILKRTLSVGTVYSATSSFAERMDALRYEDADSEALRDIGRGSCGSVFEVPGTAFAVKKGSNANAIFNDFNLTALAYNSYLASLGLFEGPFKGRRVPRVPKVHYFSGPKAREFWNTNLTRFPKEDQTRAAAFQVDRILPVPQITRKALIRKFFKEDQQTQHDVLANPQNRDCLVRIYFGKNSPNAGPYGSTDTLRNFPLHLDEAKALGLDIDECAEEMAMGLAILHWKAGIDAQDTEFVIGSSTTKNFLTVFPVHQTASPPISTMDDFTKRETQLWMLDYDKCTWIDLESAQASSDIVKKYLVAVTGNDPYFPHPRLDRDLWQKFRETYLKASDIILNARGLEAQISKLPVTLMDWWERWGDRDFEADEFDPFDRSTQDEDKEEEEEEEEEGEGEEFEE